MVTLDDIRGEAHLGDEEAENVKKSVERMVRLGMSLAGLTPRGVALPHSELAGADFTAADVANTKHARAKLTGIDRARADLTGTYFTGRTLRDANLEAIRKDLWAVLSLASREVPAIRGALVEGRVDGGTYYGECACLIGTIATARGCDVYSLGSLGPAPGRPIERFFMGIDRGDTPQTSPIAEIVVEWIDEWCARIPA
jgi:hypothetical protein